MDESLKPISMELNNVIVSLIKETEKEYEELLAEIEELNVKLSSKEMLVDRSENADFQIATDSRDMKLANANRTHKRIESMRREVGNYTPTGIITLGTTVAFSLQSISGEKPRNGQTSFIMKMVQHDTSDGVRQLLAVDSIAGSAFMGRKAGDTVTVDTLAGRVVYNIERIY